jgi:hypothetical protein
MKTYPDDFADWPDDLKSAYRAVWFGPFTFNDNPLTRIEAELKRLNNEVAELWEGDSLDGSVYCRMDEIEARKKALRKLRRMINGTEI